MLAHRIRLHEALVVHRPTLCGACVEPLFDLTKACSVCCHHRAAVVFGKHHRLSQRAVCILAEQDRRVLRRTFGVVLEARVTQLVQLESLATESGDKSIHKCSNVRGGDCSGLIGINLRVAQVHKVQT